MDDDAQKYAAKFYKLDPGEVKPGGPAAASGLRQGDRVLRVDDRPVSDAQQLREAIRAAVRDARAQPMRWVVQRQAAADAAPSFLPRLPTAFTPVRISGMLKSGLTSARSPSPRRSCCRRRGSAGRGRGRSGFEPDDGRRGRWHRSCDLCGWFRRAGNRKEPGSGERADEQRTKSH